MFRARFSRANVLLIGNYLFRISWSLHFILYDFKDKVHLPLITLGTAMEEWERINKKIELINTEVEEKQKRLSKFTFTLEELS